MQTDMQKYNLHEDKNFWFVTSISNKDKVVKKVRNSAGNYLGAVTPSTVDSIPSKEIDFAENFEICTEKYLWADDVK